ncbi:MAG: 1-hydroxycarotenoid 3,4-desaturase CrtD [Geminicoccaceae bacterium]
MNRPIRTPKNKSTPRVAVIGAGVGGLVAALVLAARGAEVHVFERAPAVGGKMRRLMVGEAAIDGGPTVFTMRWVFEAIFAEAGTALASELRLEPLDILARHAWPDGTRLDLHADIRQSADAIAAFAGRREARGYLDFVDRAKRLYDTLDGPFMRAHAPRMDHLLRTAGPKGLLTLARAAPSGTVWQALGRHFRDPRLRQLFGRYATYCGGSPFETTATLLLVAHVEQAGVWSVHGGMHALAQVLARLAEARGASITCQCGVDRIAVDGSGISCVTLSSGETVEVDAVICNSDVSALGAGLFGADVAHATKPVPADKRSLSALTYALHAKAEGFPLIRHNVFFSGDYAREFSQILKSRRLPDDPTVYVCAQDRNDSGVAPEDAAERLLVLVNAPADGDRGAFAPKEIAACTRTTFAHLARLGLRIEPNPARMEITQPADWHRLYPASGGALYGRAPHGTMASFQRPGIRTSIPGLYLASGSGHPGPGVPMAALSGQMAAHCLLEDLASTSISPKAAMPGGMSTG